MFPITRAWDGNQISNHVLEEYNAGLEEGLFSSIKSGLNKFGNTELGKSVKSAGEDVKKKVDKRVDQAKDSALTKAGQFIASHTSRKQRKAIYHGIDAATTAAQHGADTKGALAAGAKRIYREVGKPRVDHQLNRMDKKASKAFKTVAGKFGINTK